ncbi:PaaI family thioesterase [Bacillota bacterium Lsc_1132]
MKLNSTFFEKMGFLSTESAQSGFQLKLPLKKQLLQEDGVVHSGALSTMLDTVMGATVSKQFQSFATTIQLNLTFFDLTAKENYFAKTIILEQSEQYVIAEGTITDDKDELIAKGIGTFKIKPMLDSLGLNR